MKNRTKIVALLVVAIFVLLVLPDSAYGKARGYEATAQHHPYGALIGGLALLGVALGLIIVCIWFGFIWSESGGEGIACAIVGIGILLLFGAIGANLLREGAKALGIWRSALAGRIVVSVFAPLIGVFGVLGGPVAADHLKKATRGECSPVWASVLTGLFLVSGLCLAGHVLADLGKALEILPPVPLLVAYLIVGALIFVRLEPELTGNIVIDAGLMSLCCLAGGLISALGLWLWLISIPATSATGVIAWVIGSLATAFVARCLIGSKEAQEAHPMAKKDGAAKRYSFLGRLWAALPAAVLGLVIAAAITRLIFSSLVGLGAELNSPRTGNACAGCGVPNSAESLVVAGLWALAGATVLLCRIRKTTALSEGWSFVSVAKGFGYGTACLCVVCAAIGICEGHFAVLPWWVLIIAVLLWAIIICGREVEITGNGPLDSLLVALGIIGLAYVLAGGALCALACAYLSPWVLWVWIIGSLLIGLVIRVFHWASGQDDSLSKMKGRRDERSR